MEELECGGALRTGDLYQGENMRSLEVRGARSYPLLCCWYIIRQGILSTIISGVRTCSTQNGELELAVSGAAYNDLVLSGDMDRLLLFTRVFARMTPANKVEVSSQSNHTKAQMK